MKLQHKFVEFIPEVLEDGILYISLTYCTAIHKCVCGCNNEVVTPFSPTDEFEINPLDEKIGIKWGMDLNSLKISEKDKVAPTLDERLTEGNLQH